MNWKKVQSPDDLENFQSPENFKVQMICKNFKVQMILKNFQSPNILEKFQSPNQVRPKSEILQNIFKVSKYQCLVIKFLREKF